ncbi:14358_t:CDS:2, partial [Acaulospora morrowiae]
MAETPNARVKIYGSSVPGNVFVRKNQIDLLAILKANKIDYTFVDVAADEDQLKYIKRKNKGQKELPQIFVDGEYKGLFEDIENANEMRELKSFL